jgi:hypothetical protein
VDGKIQVIHAEEYDRPDFTDMINEVWKLKQRCGRVTNIYCDAANPVVWQGDGSILVAIRPDFEKLLTSLRTAVANEYKLDKEQTSYNDILDAFRLSLQFYKRSK